MDNVEMINLMFVIGVQAIMFASLSGALAKIKGHPEWGNWAVLGFFFSVFGLIGAAGLPDFRARKILEQIRVAASTEQIKQP